MLISRKQAAAGAVLQVFSLLFSPAARASVNNFHYHKSAAPGRTSLFGASMELDLNCGLLKSGPPRLIDAPQHGVVVFAAGYDHPYFNRENPHYKCRSGTYPSTRIKYRSEANYRGSDHFVIEDVSSSGDVNISEFDVQVR